MAIGADAEKILRDELGKYFTLKKESIGPPKLYLGSSMRKVVLENGAKVWSFSASQYVNAAVENVENYLKDHDKFEFPKHCNTPLTTSHRPELDISPELDPKDSSYYMSLIGILRWIVELGRVDICLEVSMMSSHMALPRE